MSNKPFLQILIVLSIFEGIGDVFAISSIDLIWVNSRIDWVLLP